MAHPGWDSDPHVPGVFRLLDENGTILGSTQQFADGSAAWWLPGGKGTLVNDNAEATFAVMERVGPVKAT
jgi:hypothetical protein